jgi:tetratricopeptide (TPR) repeat protein
MVLSVGRIQQAGTYKENIAKFEKRLNFYKKIVGRPVARSYYHELNLALLYSGAGYYDKAIELAKPALEELEKHASKQKLSIAFGKMVLAAALINANRYDEAEHYQLSCNKLIAEKLGEKGYYYALCLSNTANLYTRQGRLTLARPLLKESLAIYNTANKKHYKFKAVVESCYSYLLLKEGKKQEALASYEELYREATSQKFASHPLLLSAWNELAPLEENCGKIEEARQIYALADTIARSSYFEESERYQKAVNSYKQFIERYGDKSN